MTPLVLIGCGGFARETAQLVHAVNAQRPTWDLRGYLDDDPAHTGLAIDGTPVLGTTSMLAAMPDAAIVVCVGSPRNYVARKQIVARLGVDRARYATLVHPLAAVSRDSRVGPGTVIHAGSVLTASVDVGEHVAVMPQVVLTHDDRIDAFVTFGAGVRLAGGVHVGEGAYVGSGAAVRENLQIGEWSLIGMGSVVTRSVPSHQVWVGSPARYLRDASPSPMFRSNDAPR